MKNENLVIRLNFENEVELKLVNCRELVSVEKIIVDGKEKIKRKYKVFYDKNYNYKIFKSKMGKLKKMEGKIVSYGLKGGELKMIDYIKWNNNFLELMFNRKKEIKNSDGNLEVYENRFEWFEDLLKNKGYSKINLIPGF
jgi:hypothetical protein